MKWGAVVAVLSLFVAFAAMAVVAYIFDNGGRSSAGDAIFAWVLMMVVFVVVLRAGCGIGDKIDVKFPPKTKKPEPYNEKENQKADRVGCWIWIGLMVGSAILAMLLGKK